jgi:hypothetical protein
MLWVGQGFDIYQAEWPNWTQDRSADDRCPFAAGGDFRFGEFDADRPDMQKDWHEVRIRSRNLGTGAGGGGRVGILYRMDEEDWEALGTVNTSPSQALAFPGETVSYKLQLRGLIMGDGDTEFDTMVLEAVDLLYQPLPDTITQHQVWIRAVKHLKRHRGATDQRSAGEIWGELQALMELEEPFVYEDALGISYCVRAVGANKDTLRQIEAPSDEGTGIRVEGAILVTMLEVADTCPSPPIP